MSFWNSVPWTSIIKDAATNAFGVAKFLCLIHVTNQYVVSPVLAVGPSMVPTIDLTGNLVFVERLSTRFGKLAPGDIVIVRDPQNPRQILTKRLTALEGDTVTYSVDPDHPEKSETVIVPEGHTWVQGDNKYNSRDSRVFGAIPYGLIIGRAIWRVWPPKCFGPLSQKEM